MHELERSFLSSIGGAYALDAQARTALAPALEVHLERARRAWPKLALAGRDYAEHLARCAPDEGDPANAFAAMETSDLYLALGCAQGERAALEAFEEHVMPAVPRAISRIDRDDEFVREVMEEVRIKLLVGDGREPRIAGYLGRGPLTSWVQVAAIRTAYGLKRRRGHEVVGLDDDLELPIGGDPELERLRAEVQAPFREAFREALASLSPRERTILRLYLLEEVSSEAIATMYRVHRATVARWVARAREQVHAETRKRLIRTLGLDAGAFESLMGKVLSGLDVSLAAFLDSADPNASESK